MSAECQCGYVLEVNGKCLSCELDKANAAIAALKPLAESAERVLNAALICTGGSSCRVKPEFIRDQLAGPVRQARVMGLISSPVGIVCDRNGSDNVKD